MMKDRQSTDCNPNDSSGLPPFAALDSSDFFFCIQLTQLKSIGGNLEIIVEYAPRRK